MTQIENAMREAGMQLPTARERVWNVIKESMPAGVTTGALTKRLSAIPVQTIYGALHQMSQRDMVYRAKGEPRGFRAAENTYFTDMERYELLPMPGPAKKKLAQKAMGFSVPEVRPPEKPAPVQVTKFIDIDHLTIAEAKDLWRRLSKLFAN